MAGDPKLTGTSPPPRHRIRPWAVVLASLLVVALALAAVLWRQGDFWRASAANYLRERLAADFGAQFLTNELRGTWFPPGLSLGRVTLQREGEPWVLTAEDVRISFNVYAVLFGRERLGRVVLDRPRLFLRSSAPGGAVRAPAAVRPTGPGPHPGPASAVPGPAAAAAQRLRSILQPPFPLRVLEVADGRVEVVGPGGDRGVADHINLSVLVSLGAARVTLTSGSLLVERSGQRFELGRLKAGVTLEQGLARVRELVATGGPVTGSLKGTVAYSGALALTGEIAARLEEVAALAGRKGVVGGAATIAGEITGSVRQPEGSGNLVVQDLDVRGRRWPQVAGEVGWADGRLSWSQVRLLFGTGSVTSAGEVDLADGPPRYRVDAEARDLDLAKVPETLRGAAAGVHKLGGTLHWEGVGTGREATGAGRLAASFALASWPGEALNLEADVGLDRGTVAVQSLRAATRSLALAASGAWSPDTGYAARISGTVGDLQRLLPGGAVALGGSGSFEGEIDDVAGPRFSGTVRLADAAIGTFAGIAASSHVVATPGGVRVAQAAVTWPGGRGSLSGTVEIPSGRLDLAGVVTELSLASAARQFGVKPELVDGTAEGRLQVRGTAAAPEITGEITGRGLRYRGVAADSAALSLTYASRRLGIGSLRLRRGSTELTFHGELREGRLVEGEFASPAFDLADIRALGGLDLAGSLRGRLSGTLTEPVVEGTVDAGRLRAGGFDLRGAGLTVRYARGAVAVAGWVAAPDNRLRLVVEPGRNWRFESDLELRGFAPEMVRSGLGRLPPQLARVLGKATFMATGRLAASGFLNDPGSMRAELRLETFWLHAARKSLQNRAPVRISWSDGVLAVEDFQVSGEQYHFEVSGGGGLKDGWKLRAAGAVDLALFTEYWPELEEAEGLGDLELTLSGPWSAPVPEGSLTVHKALVRARPLPERLENLEGRLELRGRTLTATRLSGTIGGGEFNGGGSYDFARDRLDAHIDGRLDLALFRGRLPAARELRGPIQARLRMAGALAAPVFSGEVDILDAEMFLRPFPAKITHLRGKVLVETERLEVRDLDGQTGGGSVRLNGSLDWARTPIRVDAELVGRGILISLAGAIKAQSDLRLAVHGDVRELTLSGEVRILKARYLREFNERFPALVTAAGPAAGAGQGGGGERTRVALDLKVVAADNVWVDNKMARIETAVALQVGGRLDAPVVRGEIVGIQGEAIYLSRQFRLESGTLRFVPPSLIPVLEVQASTAVGDTQIFFLLEGPLKKLSYHLTSLPAMTQADLIALLTIGDTRSGLESKGGDRAISAGVAAFSVEPLVNALGDEVRGATGLEVLQLEPVVGDKNQISARLTLGTHLSDRLYVSYSQNLGATEDQQVAVQYSLLDYVSIWGQELRQGIYSLDLVFRYSFK